MWVICVADRPYQGGVGVDGFVYPSKESALQQARYNNIAYSGRYTVREHLELGPPPHAEDVAIETARLSGMLYDVIVHALTGEQPFALRHLREEYEKRGALLLSATRHRLGTVEVSSDHQHCMYCGRMRALHANDACLFETTSYVPCDIKLDTDMVSLLQAGQVSEAVHAYSYQTGDTVPDAQIVIKSEIVRHGWGSPRE
jgi:hypothetical protein